MPGLVLPPPRDVEFWAEIQAVLDRYPEFTDILRKINEDQDVLDDDDEMRIEKRGPFDPTSPVYVSALVMIMAVANMQGYETMILQTPPTQSGFLSDGLIVNAFVNFI